MGNEVFGRSCPRTARWNMRHTRVRTWSVGSWQANLEDLGNDRHQDRPLRTALTSVRGVTDRDASARVPRRDALLAHGGFKYKVQHLMEMQPRGRLQDNGGETCSANEKHSQTGNHGGRRTVLILHQLLILNRCRKRAPNLQLSRLGQPDDSHDQIKGSGTVANRPFHSSAAPPAGSSSASQRWSSGPDGLSQSRAENRCMTTLVRRKFSSLT